MTHPGQSWATPQPPLDRLVPSIAGSTIGGWTTTKARRSRRRRRLASGEAPSVCHVVHHEGSGRVHFSRETVEGLLAGGAFFWLDLDQPSAADFEILRDVFGFHPLAVEDSEHFGQRAKIDDYDDFVFLVVYGAAPDEDRPGRGALLLLRALPRHRPPRRLPRVRGDPRGATRRARSRSTHPSLLLYRIIDGLVDSFFPILADFDDRIDELEDGIFLQGRRPASCRRSSG